MSNTTSPQYALGLVKMLTIALIDLQKKDFGSGYPPQRIVLAPESYLELVAEAALQDVEYTRDINEVHWRGVLVQSFQVDQPYLVTARGAVVTL